MGKNIYETPRNKNKWHTQQETVEKNFVEHADEKKAHLEELKKRFKKNKKY